MKKSAIYANFHITNAAAKYALLVNGYTGTLKDALKHHTRQKFSTFDVDSDNITRFNCASLLFGGWWFNIAMLVILMGSITIKMAFDIYSKNILAHSGIHWYSNEFNGDSYSLIFTEIKVRRKL